MQYLMHYLVYLRSNDLVSCAIINVLCIERPGDNIALFISMLYVNHSYFGGEYFFYGTFDIF